MLELTDGLSDYDRRRLEGSLRRLTETGASALEVARSAVWLYGPEGDRLLRSHLFHRSSGEHVSGGELRREHFPDYFAALAEDPLIAASDVHGDPRTAGLSSTYAAPLGITAWIDAPVPGRDPAGPPRGIVRFEHLGPVRRWTESEGALARGLGSAVGAILDYFEARAEGPTEPDARPADEEPAPASSPPPDRPAAVPAEEPEAAVPAEPPVEVESPPPDAPPAPATGGPEPPVAWSAGAPPREVPEAVAPAEDERIGPNGFLAERSPAGMALVTGEGVVRSCNPALAQMLGHSDTAELQGTSLRRRLLRTSTWDDLVERVRQEGRVEGWDLHIRQPDGARVWLLVSAVSADDPGEAPDHLVVSAVNITERKNVEERLERLANRDPLTGAANRRLFQEAAENTLALADRHGRQLAILYVDLRHFKEINDEYGHEVGDRVLTHVADRLRARGRESDLTARIGGDEFAVLLAEVEGREGARKAAERFMEALRPPIKVEDLAVEVDVTIGVSLYPDHGRDVRSLLRLADQAMYRGKAWESGKIVIWDGEDTPEGTPADRRPEEQETGTEAEPATNGHREARVGESREDAALAGEGSDPPEPAGDDRFLADALEKGRLELHWQPIHRGADGERVGAEGLLRWEHPDRGRIRAREFVARAEELGWIRSFDRWVLDHISERLPGWLAKGTVDWVALNVSPLSLLSSEYMSALRTRVEEGTLLPGAVLLQTMVNFDLHPASDVGRILAELREAGFGTSLDLSGQADDLVEVVLSALPVDVLEVAPDFLHRMEGRRLRRMVSDARRERGLRLLAKKVENESQHRQARSLGCELIQGLHLGGPVPAPELLNGG